MTLYGRKVNDMLDETEIMRCAMNEMISAFGKKYLLLFCKLNDTPFFTLNDRNTALC